MYLQMVCRSGSFPDPKKFNPAQHPLLNHLKIGLVWPGGGWIALTRIVERADRGDRNDRILQNSPPQDEYRTGRKNSICPPDGGIREGRCRGYRGWGSRGREHAVQGIVLGVGVIKDSMKVF